MRREPFTPNWWCSDQDKQQTRRSGKELPIIPRQSRSFARTTLAGASHSNLCGQRGPSEGRPFRQKSALRNRPDQHCIGMRLLHDQHSGPIPLPPRAFRAQPLTLTGKVRRRNAVSRSARVSLATHWRSCRQCNLPTAKEPPTRRLRHDAAEVAVARDRVSRPSRQDAVCRQASCFRPSPSRRCRPVPPPKPRYNSS